VFLPHLTKFGRSFQKSRLSPLAVIARCRVVKRQSIMSPAIPAACSAPRFDFCAFDGTPARFNPVSATRRTASARLTAPLLSCDPAVQPIEEIARRTNSYRRSRLRPRAVLIDDHFHPAPPLGCGKPDKAGALCRRSEDPDARGAMLARAGANPEKIQTHPGAANPPSIARSCLSKIAQFSREYIDGASGLNFALFAAFLWCPTIRASSERVWMILEFPSSSRSYDATRARSASGATTAQWSGLSSCPGTR